MDMITYRVGEEPWDGKSVSQVEADTLKWVDYNWVGADKHLYMHFFASDGELQDVVVSSMEANPLPAFWKDSENREMEILPHPDELDLSCTIW